MIERSEARCDHAQNIASDLCAACVPRRAIARAKLSWRLADRFQRRAGTARKAEEIGAEEFDDAAAQWLFQRDGRVAARQVAQLFRIAQETANMRARHLEPGRQAVARRRHGLAGRKDVSGLARRHKGVEDLKPGIALCE